MRKVEVVSPDPAWPAAFARAAQEIAVALDNNVVAMHHIGSTAIPDIYAKPIIDLLIEVAELERVDAHQAAMTALGYQAMGEYGIPGRRYFRRDNAAGVRTHHVHAFAADTDQVRRHLAFRDYLVAHPAAAQEYSELKRRLAQAHPTDIEQYMDGKHDFIQAIDQQAAQWSAAKSAARSSNSSS
ncbi:MAG: GrpB family protein [Cyanobacteria bacterium P01_H01_bin.162]